MLVKYLHTESRIFRIVPFIPVRLRVKFPQIIWIVIGNGEYKLIVWCTLVLLIIYFHYKLMRHLFWCMFPWVVYPSPSSLSSLTLFHSIIYLFVQNCFHLFSKNFLICQHFLSDNTVEIFYSNIFKSIFSRYI